MTQPVLPLELHKLIIDIIGDKDIGDALEHPPYMLKEGALDTLRACSLVCKDWHSLTLRQTFRKARLDLRPNERGLKRCAELYQLLDANPLIKRCIRSVEMDFDSLSSREAVERVCHAVSPIEALRVVIDHYKFKLSRPSPFDGLHPILTTQHFRDLTISSNRLPLYLLEDLANLRSLTLEGVQTVDVDDNHNGTWRSSTLEKLVLKYAMVVFNQIWAVILGHQNVGLAAFFDRLKYLDMNFNTDSITRSTSWASLLARWKRLETLVVRWGIEGKFVSIRCFGAAPNTNRLHLLEGESAKMLELSQIIPWESFQALQFLTYHISQYLGRWLSSEVDHQPSTLIFTGPSRLPNLQDLHVAYRNRSVLYSEDALDIALYPIYFYDLNKTMEDPSSFSSLQIFRMEVLCMLTLGGGPSPLVQNGDSERLARMVVDRLPAVFGVGGRKETCGWTTSVIPTVRIVTWTCNL